MGKDTEAANEIISETIKKAAGYQAAGAIYEKLATVYEQNKDFLRQQLGTTCINCTAIYEPTDGVKNITCKNCGKHPTRRDS